MADITLRSVTPTTTSALYDVVVEGRGTVYVTVETHSDGLMEISLNCGGARAATRRAIEDAVGRHLGLVRCKDEHDMEWWKPEQPDELFEFAAQFACG